MPGALVQSLTRGLQILELAAASEQGVSLGEMAAALQVSPPTAHNLGRTLVAKGYLEKTARPVRYRLGAAVPQLAHARERRVWLREAEAQIRELYAQLRVATVLVAEPVAGEMMAALRMDPTRPGVLERFPNWALPPYGTALALCYQAFASDAARREYRQRHPFAEYGAAAWGTEAALDTFLVAARRQGLVVVCSNHPYRVAAPIFGPGNVFTGGIGASLSATRSPDSEDRARCAAHVQTAATVLSRVLGRV